MTGKGSRFVNYGMIDGNINEETGDQAGKPDGTTQRDHNTQQRQRHFFFKRSPGPKQHKQQNCIKSNK